MITVLLLRCEKREINSSPERCNIAAKQEFPDQTFGQLFEMTCAAPKINMIFTLSWKIVADAECKNFN
jgi:hypothetical protein